MTSIAARLPGRKLLMTLIVVGLAATAVSFGVFSAFSSTTTNPGNSFSAGTVTIGDNDGGTAVYNASGQKPGQFAEKCIKVTYSGSLASTVKLYRSAFTGGSGLDPYIDVAITKGTGDSFDCSDFSGSTSVYSGTLAAFPSAYGGGLSLTNAGGSTNWSQNDAVTYKMRATLQDTDSAQGLSTGTHSFTWEARNN
jgi:Camelysin metallo-endopeptidase